MQSLESDVLVALITGVLALIGTAIGTFSGIKTSQRVNEIKISELTREVRELNEFAKEVPVLKADVRRLEVRVKELEALHKREV